MERVDFGPEFLYALINGGKDRGSMLDDGMVAVTEHGICPRQMIPYEAYQLKRRFASKLETSCQVIPGV